VKISYHTRSRHADAPYDYQPTLKGLAEAVDTLIAIVPKTPQTHKTVNAEVLAALGPDGVLVKRMTWLPR
jgi:lactate dehydrogenase-like 2-hydroxyacid dehydrogenase